MPKGFPGRDAATPGLVLSMRALPSSIVGALLFTGAAVAQGLCGPDTPWFREFEAACRIESSLTPNCVSGVRDVAAKMMVIDPATCDLTTFWTERDKIEGQILPVLPWPHAVKLILENGKLCR